MNLGDIRVGQILYCHFTTRQFSTGAPITSASLAISIYKDDSTTESSSGVTTTFTSGFDSRAGLVSVKIDTSADGTFYAAGHDFSVVITAGTADSVSIVGENVRYFSIENRSALMPTTAGRKLDVNTNGEAGLDWANVGSPTTTLNLSGTTVKTATDVETDTQDIQGRLPAALTGDGNIKADALRIGGIAQTGRDLGLSVLLSSGTGTGQIDFTGGVVKSNLAQILGTALTETAGQIAAAFRTFFNVASPVATAASVNQTGDSYAIVNDSSFGNAKLVRSTTPANTFDVSATGEGGLDFNNIKDATGAHTLTGITIPNLTNAPTAGDFTATMKASLNAATPAVTVSDKSGFSLSTAGIQAIWDVLTSALTTAGSIGKRIVDYLGGGSKVAATVATGDDADAATLLSRITSDRAGYLNNLNVGGAVASHADIAALQTHGDENWMTASGFASAEEMAKVPKAGQTNTWTNVSHTSTSDTVAIT